MKWGSWMMLSWWHLFFFSLQEERKKSFLWWCQPSTKNYNTTDEDEQVRTVQDRMGRCRSNESQRMSHQTSTVSTYALKDMAERLARVEQSLLEIHASMKDFMAASRETWTRNSSWGSENCVRFCVLMDHVIPDWIVLLYTLINGFDDSETSNQRCSATSLEWFCIPHSFPQFPFPLACLQEQQASVGPAMSVKAGTSMSRWR